MLRRLMNFLQRVLLRPIAAPGIERVYRACVIQALQPVFYADWQVPDSVDGRFDLLVLHVLLVIMRLRDHPAQTQQLFDILFADMDKNLREMGVSDMRIAKRMKPLLAAFYGRAQVYEQALAETDNAVLAQALQRNIYGPTPASPDNLRLLTAYVRRAQTAVVAQADNDLLDGAVNFPTVA